ncbi:MAG: hypothetical protein QXE66_02320 [Desulfurococcaceae archaeon]
MVRVLFSSACHDYVTTVAYNLYTKYVEPYYRAKGIEVVQCHCQNALRDRIEETIEMYKPVAFVGCGHGVEDKYLGHGNKVVFQVCDVDPLIEKGVYLLSCLTARQLGHDIVNKGGKAYVGYYELYYIVYGTRSEDPYGDIYQASFFRPIERFLKELADGKTIKEAVEAQIDQFNKEIEYWRNSGDPDAPFVIYYLIWDRDAIRLYGDEKWKLTITVEMEATSEVRVLDTGTAERYVPSLVRAVSPEILPAIAAVGLGIGLAEEDKTRKGVGIAVGVGAIALYQYLRKVYRPLPPAPRPTEELKAESTITATDTYSPPVEMYSESSVATADYGMITPAVPVPSGSQVSVEDYAEIGFPTTVAGAEEVYVSTEGMFGETIRVSPTSSTSIADRVDVRVARVVTPATSLSVADAVSVSVAMGVMGGETVAVSSTGRFTGELSMRPASSASIADTARASVVSGLSSLVSISVADAVSVGATLGVSGAETVSVSSVAVIG